MTTSRQDHGVDRQSGQLESSDDSLHISNTNNNTPILPPLGKSYDDLTFPDLQKQLVKGRDSFHQVLRGLKSNAKKVKHWLYVKLPESENIPISQFEAVGAGLFNLFCPGVAPNTRAYYGRDGKVMAVASKQHRDFKTNKEDPLREEDLYVSGVDLLGSKKDREEVIAILKKVSEELNRGLGIRFAFNYFRSDTAAAIKTVIDEFISGERKLDRENIRHTLLPKLKTRQQFAKENEKSQRYANEKIQVDAAIDAIDTLLELAPVVSPEYIRLMEKLDKEYGNLAKECREEAIIGTFKGQHAVDITIKDLKNYRIQRGLANGLSISYLMQEGDCHNRNIAKDGRRIDFDMLFFWDISHMWKDGNLLYLLGRRPCDLHYEITARDILNFPNLEDTRFFYWPTVATRLKNWSSIGASTINSLSSVFKQITQNVYEGIASYISKNIYEESDRKNYSALKNKPIFNFHKYKDFLKFIVMPEELIKGEIYLHFLPGTKVANMETGEELDLPETVYQNVIKQQSCLKAVLLDMPEFKEFYSTYKGLLIEMIVDEMRGYRDKYAMKAQRAEGDFDNILEACSLNKIEENIENVAHLMDPKKGSIWNDASTLFKATSVREDYVPEGQQNMHVGQQ